MSQRLLTEEDGEERPVAYSGKPRGVVHDLCELAIGASRMSQPDLSVGN
jgi:hypothetical protein